MTREVKLRRCLADPLLSVMTFLNEVTSEFPHAISFAPGRPADEWLHAQPHLVSLMNGAADLARSRGVGTAAIWHTLGQYGLTNGFVTDVIATHLAADEQIRVAPEAIIVTVGAQEAMAIALAGLFDPRRDVLLVSDPTYVGVKGLARVFGTRVVPVPCGDAGLDPDTVERAIVKASPRGRVRAIYDIPDFSNPLGTSLSVADRMALLGVCRRHGVLIVEDNPYGMFAYDHPRRPTLKALDEDGTVLYVGSFSKTLFPGVRVGYLVADQRATGRGGTLAQALSCVKGLLTVNTSPLSQAIVADALRRAGGSLEPIVAPKRAACRVRRDAMVASLDARCDDLEGHVSWNRPAGGFFLTMTLPCEFGPEQVRRCAANYGVVVSPMQFFSLAETRTRQVRLAFSSASPHEIDVGIDRFIRYVREVGCPSMIPVRLRRSRTARDGP
jgi:(S)-3,5-dihydroxyphenylglycine transaminase